MTIADSVDNGYDNATFYAKIWLSYINFKVPFISISWRIQYAEFFLECIGLIAWWLETWSINLRHFWVGAIFEHTRNLAILRQTIWTIIQIQNTISRILSVVQSRFIKCNLFYMLQDVYLQWRLVAYHQNL